jgi:HlyD family secretion protein
MFRKYVLPGAGVVLLLFAIYHAVRAQQSPGKSDPLVEPAGSPYRATVAGTGMVEPETENIAIGSHNPGVVDQVLVKVGDRVVKGQTALFRLDDRLARSELAVRSANLKAAQAQLEKLKSMPRPEEVPAAEARVREAEEGLADQVDQYERIAKLAQTNSISDNELVRRKQAMEVARAQRERAKADLRLLKAGAWQADLLVAEATVAQAKAQVRSAQTELDRLTVKAPVDGEILQVNVRPGEYVATPANQALVVLGGIKKHVRVDIDENDLARFREGLPAKAKRRGDAATEIPLRFVRIESLVVPKKSLAGGTTERTDTRVLQVIYAVERPNVPLYVGQQVDVFLDAAK